MKELVKTLRTKRSGFIISRYLLPQACLLLITATVCAQAVEFNKSPLNQDFIPHYFGSFIGLSTGYNHITTRNDASSPLLSQGSSALFSLKYFNERLKHVQLAKIDYFRNVITSSANNPSDLTYRSFSYKYYRKVALWKKDRYQFYAGVGTTTYVIDRNFRPIFMGEELTFAISSTIGPAAYLKYALSEKDRVIVSCQLAVLGYTVKSGYANTLPDKFQGENTFNNVIMKSGDLLPVGRLWVGEASLSYQRNISKRFLAEFYSELNYLNIMNGRTFSFANNPIMCSLLFKLLK